jgi:hypothetical protein
MCFSAWNTYPVLQLRFGNLRFSNYLSIRSLLSPLFCFTTMFHSFLSFFHCFLLFSFPPSFRPFQPFFVLSHGATLHRASNLRPAVSAVRFRLSLDGPTGCQFRRQWTSAQVSTLTCSTLVEMLCKICGMKMSQYTDSENAFPCSSTDIHHIIHNHQKKATGILTKVAGIAQSV